MPQIIAADYLRSEFSVQIGWLVTDPKNPHNDHSPYELPPPEDSIIISEQEGIFEHNRSTYSSRIQGMLTKFLSLSASNGNSNAAQLVAGRGRRYMLENSGKYFRSLLQTEPGATETKKWMEEAILNQGEDVFLVIGLATVRDGNLERYTESNSRITGEATVPLAGAVGGAAQVVVGNVSASVSHNREDGNRVRFTGVGEQVYAVEYRKVKFRFLRSKEIDKGTLESGTRWEMFWTMRGSQNDEDVLEAELCDEGLDEDSLEDHETVDLNGEEVMFTY